MDEEHFPTENLDVDAKIVRAVASFQVACEAIGIMDFEAIIRAHVLDRRSTRYQERVWARVDELALEEGDDAEQDGHPRPVQKARTHVAASRPEGRVRRRQAKAG